MTSSNHTHWADKYINKNIGKERYTIGDMLFLMRVKRHLSRKTLAQKLKISVSLLSHWERGERLPSLVNLMAITRCLNYSLKRFDKCLPIRGSHLKRIVRIKRTVTFIPKEVDQLSLNNEMVKQDNLQILGQAMYEQQKVKKENEQKPTA